MDYLNEIAKQPWLGLIPILTGIIVAAIAILNYRKKNKKMLLGYIKRSLNLIGSEQTNFADLKVAYKNHDISKLTITTVVIWNAGRIVIRGKEDVAALDKVRICLKNDAKLLEVKLLKVSDTINNVTLSSDFQNNKTDLHFEHLHHKQGATIQIIHSGSDSDDVVVEGTIIGQGKIKSLEGDIKRGSIETIFQIPINRTIPEKGEKRAIFWIPFLAGIGLIVLAFLGSHFWVATVLFIMGVIHLAISLFIGVISRTQIPKEFEFIQQ